MKSCSSVVRVMQDLIEHYHKEFINLDQQSCTEVMWSPKSFFYCGNQSRIIVSAKPSWIQDDLSRNQGVKSDDDLGENKQNKIFSLEFIQ